MSPKSNPKSGVVRVGVGVLVQDPSDPTKVLCGIRKGSHGAGSLALPGGHLEMYESWEECAIREVEEECGLELDPTTLFLAHVTNDPMPAEEKRYVALFLAGKCLFRDPPQVPQTMEPDKCEGWTSYSWSDLEAILQTQRSSAASEKAPRLFGPLERLVDQTPPGVLAFLGETS